MTTFSTARCSLCGGSRLLKDGALDVCSFLSCADPLYDLRAEEATARRTALHWSDPERALLKRTLTESDILVKKPEPGPMRRLGYALASLNLFRCRAALLAARCTRSGGASEKHWRDRALVYLAQAHMLRAEAQAWGRS